MDHQNNLSIYLWELGIDSISIVNFSVIKLTKQKMTPEELYNSVIDDFPITDLHPLHKAMMEECCETALQSNPEITDKKTLTLAVQVAFLTCNSTLKATLNSSIELADADQVTIDYRNQTFTILKSSNLLK